MVFHGQTITHIDALSHYSWQGKLYNGKPASLITSREGAQTHSIEPACDGIVTRGVLLDIPKIRGVSWLPPEEPVMPQDLEEAERSEGVRVEEGDILLVRTGNYRKRLDTGPVPGSEPMTACQVACTPWFKERGIAMLGTDTSNDVRPSHYATITSPLHTMCLVTLGLWLIDNANLEQLAEACQQRNRYEFMLTLAPLRLRNVTGSPVNPIALFYGPHGHHSRVRPSSNEGNEGPQEEHQERRGKYHGAHDDHDQRWVGEPFGYALCE